LVGAKEEPPKLDPTREEPKVDTKDTRDILVDLEKFRDTSSKEEPPS